MEEEEEHYEAGALYIIKLGSDLDDESTKSQEQVQTDPNHTVDYLKSKLDNLLKADSRIQKKLKKLHRMQFQLSLLINKNIEGKYGLLVDNSKIPKINAPPLPPLEKGTLSDLLRIIHSSSPSDLNKYIIKSGVIEQLIFGDTSIFNSQLLESLLRTPPDVQVSFIVSLLDQIKVCSQLYSKILSMLSQLSLEESLRSQLISPNANFSHFINFYDNVLKQIAELCKSDECKIVYLLDENQKLLYPTKSYSYIISIEDSLSGALIQSSKPSRIESPHHEKSFETISERYLFDCNDPILSVPFFISHGPAIGLIILIRHSSTFSITDEKISARVTEYLTPILQLFRKIFTQATPSQYEQLFQCVDSIRNTEKPLFETIKENFCTLTSATFCKLYVSGSDSSNYPELKELPQSPSLVRKSYESQTVLALKNPRSHACFSKEVDDEVTLSKITSLLIIPVKNSPLIIALYNPKAASEFAQLHALLAEALARALQPRLAATKSGAQPEESEESGGEARGRPLLGSPDEAPLLGAAESSLPRGVAAALFFLADDGRALHLPSRELVELPKTLAEIEEPTVIRLVGEEAASAKTSANKTDSTSTNACSANSNDSTSTNACSASSNDSTSTNACSANSNDSTSTNACSASSNDRTAASASTRGASGDSVASVSENGYGGCCRSVDWSNYDRDFTANLFHGASFLLAVPSDPPRASLCVFAASDSSAFAAGAIPSYAKRARSLLLLGAPLLACLALSATCARRLLSHGACLLSPGALSSLVGARIECQIFEVPLAEGPKLGKPLSLLVETPGGVAAALTSDAPIKTADERRALISFAELMSSVLTAEKKRLEEPNPSVISFFVDKDVLGVFGCTQVKFGEWLSRVFAICAKNNVDTLKKFECACFVWKMIVAKKWENWFSAEERIVIILIAFLRDIPKCWKCQADDELVKLFYELKCRPISGLFCSILFGKGFGIAGDSLSLSKKKTLIKLVDNFIIGESAREISEVSANVRVISLQSFKLNQKNKIWLGRAFVMLSSLQLFAELNEKMVVQYSKDINETDKRKLIYKIERVFLPMLSYLSQRNDDIILFLTNVRSSLKILHSNLA